MRAYGEKRYVDVVARWHADGYVEPLIVCWPDGRSFQVERIEGTPQSSTFPGAEGRVQRYTVVVDGMTTQLFLEHGGHSTRDSARWYVERRAGTSPWNVGGMWS